MSPSRAFSRRPSGRLSVLSIALAAFVLAIPVGLRAQAKPPPPVVQSVTANRTFPVMAGTAITWTATASGGAAPLQYLFWRLDGGNWTVARHYSTDKTYTWTPGAGEVGQRQIWVWVRNAGSVAAYDAQGGTAPFTITAAPTPRPPVVQSVTANRTFPVMAGTAITWTANASGGASPLQYRFWRLDGGNWKVARDYSTDKTYTWTPGAGEVGQHQVWVWVRNAGSVAAYNAQGGTAPFITAAPAPPPPVVQSVAANRTFPVIAGTAITWTANASGGAAPLQYRFWRLDGGNWKVARDYSTDKTYTWTPGAGEVGQHQIWVWVRNAGSAAAYDAQGGTAPFITAAPVVPDLTVSELALASTQLRPGTTMSATFTIKNIGSSTAASHLAALLFRGCDDSLATSASVLKTVQIPPLGPGASTRITTTATVPGVAPGTHCVTARADSGRTIVEAVESNNDRTTPVQVNVINVTLVPHVDPSQMNLPYPFHSHYKHPWRGWLDTLPASAYLDGIGLNYHVDVNRVRDDVEIRLLAESGISRLRIEVGWGRTDYDSLDILPPNKARLTSILTAAKANGIRPLILLNGHHGYPVPHRQLSARTVSATAAAGSRTLQLSDVTGISPAYTGLSNLTDYKMAEVIITAVNASTRTVTLSKPLPVSLRAGQSVRLDTLRYQPLSEPGTAAFEETVAGWLAYVRAAVRAVLATGITDFDVEIWNELTFASTFLYINQYYSPPIVPDRDAFRPGMRVWELARRTVAMLAAEYPRVTPIWGISNTTFFHVLVPDLPPGMLGQSYHPYEFAEYDSPSDEHLGMVHNIEGFAPQTPPYRVVMPESAGMFIRSDTPFRHLVPEGRQERPAASPVFRHYMTEWGFNPSGYGVTDLDEAGLLKAKAVLRSSFFWLNKGLTGLYFFADYLEHNLLKYDLLSDSVAQLSSYPSNPDAYLTLPFKALGNATRAFEGATYVATPRQLGAEAAAANGQGGGIIFRGDATHPDLTYQDAFAIFPFQVDSRTFVIALYVMTRNILEAMPETQFIVKLTNVDGRDAVLRYLDPLTGTQRPVDVIERTASSLIVSVPVADTPYLLTITE